MIRTTLGLRWGGVKPKVWADHDLKPWKVSTFKISNDPYFEVKLVDVVGLYLKPPKRAVVFGFDEKTRCQAMDRTQPSLPMVPGRAGTMTHDDKRNGTTDLFAAMNVATGEVLTHCNEGHTAKDVLRFFKQIDATVPRGLAVHVVLDNFSAHTAPEITTWLAHKDRRRWHLHFTPTSSSWTNLIERWFKELTDRRLRRGVFTSVNDLEDAIKLWATARNDDPKPFIWKATADDIIAKVRRGRAALTRQTNTTTDHWSGRLAAQSIYHVGTRADVGGSRPVPGCEGGNTWRFGQPWPPRACRQVRAQRGS